MGEPVSQVFNDRYFYKNEGLEESSYVYLIGNKLKDRWGQLNENEIFSIGELGFGTGLNFLNTLKLWKENKKAGTKLNYVSIEKFPLTKEDIKKSLSNYPSLKNEIDLLILKYPKLIRGFHRINFEKEDISLTLIFQDIDQSLYDLEGSMSLFDAWFLDGFSPKENNEMWTDDVFKNIAKLSHSETTASSFSVASNVKDSLKRNNFNFFRSDGFKNKRHMLEAVSTNSIKKLSNKKKEIAVIGAGISGACLANSLAKRGHKITVFEKEESSNNIPCFVGHPNLSHANTPYSRYLLQSFLFSTNYYLRNCNSSWNRTGVLVLEGFGSLSERLRKISKTLKDKELFREVDNNSFPELDFLKKDLKGFFFSDSGWLHTEKAIKQLLSHKNIRLINEEVLSLISNEPKFKKIATFKNEYIFDEICLCNSYDAKKILGIQGVNKKRGQVTEVSNLDLNLNQPICGKGYITPFDNSRLLIGSTYSEGQSEEIIEEDNKENLELIKEMFNLNLSAVNSYVGFRSTTKDHLPLLGEKEGFYLNLGHGSKGSISSPFCAEILCDVIDGCPIPTDKEVFLSLDPDRFNS